MTNGVVFWKFVFLKLILNTFAYIHYFSGKSFKKYPEIYILKPNFLFQKLTFWILDDYKSNNFVHFVAKLSPSSVQAQAPA